MFNTKNPFHYAKIELNKQTTNTNGATFGRGWSEKQFKKQYFRLTLHVYFSACDWKHTYFLYWPYHNTFT